MLLEDFVALPIVSVRRTRRLLQRETRYRIGPLASRSDPPPVGLGASMRNGALAGLAVAAALGLPVFLVLGMRAPAPERPATEAETARVWTEPDSASARPVPTRVATAAEPPVPSRTSAEPPVPSRTSAEPPPVAKAGADRPALARELIPVLDDESGDLSFEAAAPAQKPAIRTGRFVPAQPRPAAPIRP